MYNCSFYNQVVRKENRGQKICIDIGYNNSHFIPILLTENISEISSLGQIIQWKIDRIIHVAKLVNVAKTNLYRQNMPEVDCLSHNLNKTYLTR